MYYRYACANDECVLVSVIKGARIFWSFNNASAARRRGGLQGVGI